MRFPSRRRRQAEAEAAKETAALPALRAEQAVVMLAVQSRQLHHRLALIEQRLNAPAEPDPALELLPTHDDLLEVRLHSARVSAEVTRMAVELQARIDELAVRMPAVVAEDERQQRARVFAETILELSDSLDTAVIDLRDAPGQWAATA